MVDECFVYVGWSTHVNPQANTELNLSTICEWNIYNRARQCYFMKESLHISQSCVTNHLFCRRTIWYQMIDHQPVVYALLKVTTKYWENKNHVFFADAFEWRIRFVECFITDTMTGKSIKTLKSHYLTLKCFIISVIYLIRGCFRK